MRQSSGRELRWRRVCVGRGRSRRQRAPVAGSCRRRGGVPPWTVDRRGRNRSAGRDEARRAALWPVRSRRAGEFVVSRAHCGWHASAGLGRAGASRTALDTVLIQDPCPLRHVAWCTRGRCWPLAYVSPHLCAVSRRAAFNCRDIGIPFPSEVGPGEISQLALEPIDSKAGVAYRRASQAAGDRPSGGPACCRRRQRHAQPPRISRGPRIFAPLHHLLRTAVVGAGIALSHRAASRGSPGKVRG